MRGIDFDGRFPIEVPDVELGGAAARVGFYVAYDEFAFLFIWMPIAVLAFLPFFVTWLIFFAPFWLAIRVVRWWEARS